MTNIIPSENRMFIQPSPKLELNGELGLYASEIAKSLSMMATEVRRKLKSGFLERIQSCGFDAMGFSILNENNGIPYTEYVLDVDAAKFFVGKSNTELGDQYLAYLLKTERELRSIQKQCQEDPWSARVMRELELRQHQLDQGKDILKLQKFQEKQEEQNQLLLERTKPELIEQTIADCWNAKTAFPEGCITFQEASHKYFHSMTEKPLKTYLEIRNHPKKKYDFRKEGTTEVYGCYVLVEEGLDKEAYYFFSGVQEISKPSGVNYIYTNKEFSITFHRKKVFGPISLEKYRHQPRLKVLDNEE